VGASTELAVNIGAEASFFDLFDASTGKTLFKKDFPLLQKCVGSNVVSRMLPVSRQDHALRAGDDTDTFNSSRPYARSQSLVCPLLLVTQLSQIVNAVIPA